MKVLNEYVVLSCKEGEEEKTASGIIVPVETREIDDSTQETVLAVGEKVKGVKEGDRVLFKRNLFQLFEVEKKSLLVGKEEAIIAVL